MIKNANLTKYRFTVFLFSLQLALFGEQNSMLFLNSSAGMIAYLDTGGVEFPIILVHGNSCSSAVFQKQIEALKDKYRLIAADLPGHGKSEFAQYPEQVYTIPGYAKILDELVHHLKLKAFGVIGFSLGGNIALQWSQMNQHIRGIVMISSAPIRYSQDAFLAYPPYEGSYGGYPEVLTKIQATQYMTACGFTPEDTFMIEDAMRTDPKSRFNMVASVLRGQGIDETEIVANRSPLLAIVVGEKDPALGIHYMRKLSYHNLWSEKIWVIPNASHAIPWHQANTLQPILEDFFQEISY